MPDYFVSMDTSNYSDYYRDMIRKGILNRFLLQYVDENRDELLSKYPDFKTFNKEYHTDQQQEEALIDFAVEEELAFDQDQWDRSIKKISLLMKAYLARDLWDMTRFYEVYNSSDEIFNKAVEILNDPSMLTDKLAKAEAE